MIPYSLRCSVRRWFYEHSLELFILACLLGIAGMEWMTWQTHPKQWESLTRDPAYPDSPDAPRLPRLPDPDKQRFFDRTEGR